MLHVYCISIFEKAKLNIFIFLPPMYVVRREGNSFTLFVSSHLGGYPYPIMLCNISQNTMGQPPGGYPTRSSWGGYPASSAGVTLVGGYPGGGYHGRGYPGGIPCQGVPGVGVPRSGTPPAWSGWGGYPVRTT